MPRAIWNGEVLAESDRFEEVEGWSQEERNLAAEAIYRFVFRGLYELHAFNGDPHPGNYLFRPGGHVTRAQLVVLLDEPRELAQ